MSEYKLQDGSTVFVRPQSLQNFLRQNPNAEALTPKPESKFEVYNIMNNVTRNSPNVIQNVGNKYFSTSEYVNIDNIQYKGFEDYRNRKGNLLSESFTGFFDTYETSEEEDLKTYFEKGRGLKYSDYEDFKNNETFNFDLVSQGDIEVAINEERNRAAQRYISTLDDDKLRVEMQENLQNDFYSVFDAGDEVDEKYITLFKDAVEKDKKLKTQGTENLPIFTDPERNIDIIQSWKGYAGQNTSKVMSNYIEEKGNSLKKQIDQLESEFEKIGKVDQNSSPQKIKEYNALIEKYNKLTPVINKFHDNIEKTNNADIAIKAFNLRYRFDQRSKINLELSLSDAAMQGAGIMKWLGVGDPLDYDVVYSYNQLLKLKKEAMLPLPQRAKDLTFRESGEIINNIVSENVFSIASALSAGGLYALAAKGVVKQAVANRAATAISASFGLVEGGSKLASLEERQRNAAKQLPKLRKELSTIENESERLELLKIIDQYEDDLNVTERDKAFSSITYGGIAMVAERLGTMNIMKRLAQVAKSTGPITFKNVVKGVGFYGFNTGVETTEEVLTQIGHNLVDNVLLKENKSLLDGVDPDFFMNVVFSSLAIQGPSMGMGVINSVRSEITTRKERKKSAERQARLIDLKNSYDNLLERNPTSLTPAQQEEMRYYEVEIMKLMKEAALADFTTFADVANMDDSDIRTLFENMAKIRELKSEAMSQGSIKGPGERTNYENKRLQKIKNKINVLVNENEQLRKKPEERRLEALQSVLGKDNVDVESAYYFGQYKNYLKVVQDTENADTLEFKDFAAVQKHLIGLVEKGDITMDKYESLSNQLKSAPGTVVENLNQIILIEDNVINNLKDPALNRDQRAFIAYAALHELQHLEDIKAGVITGVEAEAKHKQALKELSNHLENLYQRGDLKKERYKTARKRLDQYINKRGIRLDELKPLYGEFINAGIVSKNNENVMLSLKSFLNGVYKQAFGNKSWLFNMRTAEDVLAYIRSFQNRALDRTLSLQIPPDEEVAGEKASKSISRSGAVSAVNEIEQKLKDKLKEQGIEYTQDEFRKSNEFNDLFESIALSGGAINNYIKGLKMSPEKTKATIESARDRLMNYDPQAQRKADSKEDITIGERIMSDIGFAKLDAAKKLATKRKDVSLDDPGIKDIPDDTQGKKQEPTTPDTKARALKDFDVQLEDQEFVDAAVLQTVEALIEQNPANLEAKMEKLILTDIRKMLDDNVPKIAKNKKTGKREPTPEYEAWIRNEYDEIVPSLGISVIRKAYKSWFKQEKTGKKDYSGISKKTGKKTNYVKDTQKNITNKREYIRWFLESNERNLTERRTALLRRVAKRKADIIIDDYIINNSKDINKIVEAKLRKISRTADETQAELASFDTVKFSLSISERTEELYKSGEFADRGRALEQAMIEVLQAYGFPPEVLKLAEERATEKGGLADISLEIFGQRFNLEVKMDSKVPMGSVVISSYNTKTGKFEIAKSSMENSVNFGRILKSVSGDINKLVTAYNEKVTAYNKKNKTNEPLMDTKNPIGHAMVESIYNELVKEKFTGNIFRNSEVISKDLQPLIDHYLAKPYGGVEAIEILGLGLYSFVENSRLKSVPYIKDLGKVKTKLRVINSGAKARMDKRTSNVKVMREGKMQNDRYVRFTLQYQNTLTGLKKPSDQSVINEESIRNMIGLQPEFKQPIGDINKFSKAISNGRITNKEARGMSTFDFDETLIDKGENFIIAKKDDEEIKISSGQWPIEGPRYAELGYEFDFTDFVNVRGGIEGPLLQKMRNQVKKFGPENVFVLTARPPQSATAIHEWLKTKGINIPFENITGLGNSTGEAKAMWMLEKFSEGYNDMYFVDDALPNVKAVKNALEQLDIKSNVQQAKSKFSLGISENFNNILEDVTGIDSKKRFSAMKARKRGESKGKFRFFIPPSHEDFVGLLYNFMGKGRLGDSHRKFFEQALVRPLNRAYREIDTAKQAIANDYKSLNKQFSDVNDMLIKKTPDKDFTYQDAIRVYLWNKHGYTIPGLAATDQANLVKIVTDNADLVSYAEAINKISRQEAYVDPGPNWETGNIRIDLVDATGRVGRASYFVEFNENTDKMFDEANLNKIEAAYGKSFREALEDMLHRIKTGVNRPKGASARPNAFMNWLNASVSGVMFFNTRSALLQQLSNINFINFADNNIIAAAKAFANQKQYWKDFAFIFNSDMLKQRRGGLQTDINGAELAEAIKKARPGNMFDQVAIITGKALKLGFLPTQIGDSIAIATGGAAFYRNRINKYIKDGLSKKEAEAKAFTDLQDITNSTQQSARPDMTSKQQAMWIGKLVLNFLNTPSQYNRIIKKAGSDIINRRITPPNTTQFQSDASNMSRILYYGAIQNLIFYGLQTALFAVMFNDDKEENEQFLKKKERVINGTIDTILRGSGIYGVAVSTIKNMAIKFLEQREKGYNKDESAVLMEALNFSPVVGIRARKLVNAEKTLNYNENIISEMETFDADNPVWSAATNYIEVAGPPANRIYQKATNLRDAMNNEYTALQRVMLFSGYTKWSLGIEDDLQRKKKYRGPRFKGM